MNYHYHKYRSQIVDCLCFPSLLNNRIDDYTDSLTPELIKIFEDIQDTIKQLEQILEPYRQRIEKYYLDTTFPLYLYQMLLEAGQDPKTMDAFYACLQTVSEVDIEKSIALSVGEDLPFPLSEAQLLEVLEDSVESDQQRWRLFWAYRHPKETVQELIALYRDLLPFYLPFQKQYEKECDRLVEHLDPESWWEGVFDLKSLLREQVEKENCHLFILSPWYSIVVLGLSQPPANSVYLYTCSRTREMVEAHKNRSEAGLAVALKMLGDENRYQVLKAVSKGNLKNKEIAEQLGITSANVSFHANKLLNAALLKIDSADSKGFTKYKINKSLLREAIARLQKDFEL